MAEAGNIEVELIKLADGARLLRFADTKSGLALERKLDPARPVHEQQKELGDIFQAAVARAQLTLA
jgi:hypothetical protein